MTKKNLNKRIEIKKLTLENNLWVLEYQLFANIEKMKGEAIYKITIPYIKNLNLRQIKTKRIFYSNRIFKIEDILYIDRENIELLTNEEIIN